MQTTTITVSSAPYTDLDDCLAAAESDAQDRYGLAGYDLTPRWTDEANRAEITMTIPEWAVASDTVTTRALTESDTALWEDDGPDGDDFRRSVREQHRGASMEICSHDGITLDAWRA